MRENDSFAANQHSCPGRARDRDAHDGSIPNCDIYRISGADRDSDRRALRDAYPHTDTDSHCRAD